MLQILHLQRICNRYLQRCNTFILNKIIQFRCRWQIKQHFTNLCVGKNKVLKIIVIFDVSIIKITGYGRFNA